MQQDERKEEMSPGQAPGNERQPDYSRFEEISEVQDSQAGVSGSEVMGAPGGSTGEAQNSEQGTRNAD